MKDCYKFGIVAVVLLAIVLCSLIIGGFIYNYKVAELRYNNGYVKMPYRESHWVKEVKNEI